MSTGGLQSSLRRSKSSLHSLSSLDGSTAVSSPRALRQRWYNKKSSSSLSVSTDSIYSSGVFKSGSLETIVESKTASDWHLGGDSKVEIFQWTLILAVWLQVPQFYHTFIEIVDFHIHTFPVLIILASAFHANTTPSNKEKADVANQDPINAKPETVHPSTSDDDITINPPPKIKSSTSGQAFDEWGHFADFEPPVQEREVSLLRPDYARAMSLASLQETEYEEEDD